MKVALVRGPLVSPRGSINNEPTPPLGLAYLAGSLKEAGFEVQGIDATGEALGRVAPIPNSRLRYHGIGIDEILERIDPETRVVGVSSMFSHEWTYYRSLITAIKERFPDAVIVAGGEHSSALPEYILNDCPELDCIGFGEGEETIVDLSRAVEEGRDIKTVPGLGLMVRTYLENKYVYTGPRTRIREVDEIPWPDWDTFSIDPYFKENFSFGPSLGRNMPFLASRGCPYQCTFCSNPLMWTTRYYTRNVDQVLAEIGHYKERFDITGVQFYDLTAIVKKDWIMEFCQKITETGWNLDWSLPSGTRSEALDEEALGWMHRSNCRYLVYAPESGSEETLRLIKKKIKLPRMEASVREAIQRGIVVRTNMIIGFPHETRKQLFETLWQQLKFAWMGVEDAPLHAFQPYPGTELFSGLVDSGEMELNDAYFEALASLSNGKTSIPDRSYCEHMGRVELYIYRMTGMALFYGISYIFFPQRVLRTIKNIFLTDQSSTVLEQRLKDRTKRLRALWAAFRKRWLAPSESVSGK